MATRYVSDEGSNTSPYDTMAKAATLITGAGQVAGDTVLVESGHTEAQAANITIPGGSQGSPIIYISVNKSTEEEELMSVGGGSIGATTGGYDTSFGAWIITKGLDNIIASDEMKFISGDVTCINSKLTYDDNIYTGTTDHKQKTTLINTDITQITTGQIIFVRSNFEWRGGVFLNSGNVATYLFSVSGAEGQTIVVEGVDFQRLTSGDYLLNAPIARSNIHIIGCKVPSGYAGLITGTINVHGVYIKAHNVSSEDTLIAIAEYSYQGLCTDEDSIYTGASELSIEMAANANVEAGLDGLQFELFHGYSAANPTFTVELNVDEATALADNDVWLDIFGPNDTIGALSLLTSTKASDIMNPTTLTSSSETWTGTGAFSNEQKRKITKILTGYQAGVYKIVVNVAKNITVYVDIDVAVS